MSSISAEEELEDLFDSIADAKQRELHDTPAGAPSASAHAAGAAQPSISPTDLYTRIGNLARQLHDALSAIGADKVLTRVAKEVPDARDRLSYIARVTEQAADRVLAAVEVAQATHAQLTASTDALAPRWERFFARDMSLQDFRQLACDTRMHFAESQGKSGVIGAQLHEIMMAQDFQDLTGQVIQKLTVLVGDFESQLLRFLIEALPPEKQAEYSEELSGPSVNGKGADVVSDQAQVDDLLESLGF